MSELVIRQMTLEDIPGVLEVEEASFAEPWDAEVFHKELCENEHAYYFVACIQERIIGYIGSWIVWEDGQITNFAVHPDMRGHKIGEKLFGYVMALMTSQGIERLSLEVRVSNVVAQSLYRKFGLVPGGIRKHYYTDNFEDAMVMWVNLK
ncbi:ribosomal protein S18-alanine N-acetyltransferase [Oceanobacillus sp. J11TS1]|uniref:ribosomal protein S18-alanine N-acetyltransferase n=1 Tax=Oceanobacillus sp. J11TS1 TaxID=2807191 RepID=UPI001B159CD1|nr:ribosomal protein S18-alanine N-acetyltransferase [Oceanobacillus sp. J11TS1]GIO25041.1 ribosomal-protein-alanine acetyltransferase [Oceanobacillus sp. J11TS1]